MNRQVHKFSSHVLSSCKSDGAKAFWKLFTSSKEISQSGKLFLALKNLSFGILDNDGFHGNDFV